MMTVAMNRLLTLATVFVFCFAIARANAQTLAGGALKANLDLPFDAGLLNDDGEDEDAPEIITFYSQQYEGDALGLWRCAVPGNLLPAIVDAATIPKYNK